MAANNAGHKLYGVWRKRYKEAHGVEYVGSKYREAGMLKGVADDIGEQALRALIDFYFDYKSNHDFTQFIFNYDKLLREIDARERDRKYQERVRARTRERLQELDIEL
jgi:hypothetical protein